MDHDFYGVGVRGPDAHARLAFGGCDCRRGVAASVAERNEMLAYALSEPFRARWAPPPACLGRILSGYEKAKRLQIRGMIAYAVVAVLALVVVLSLPLSMDMELRVLVWLSFAGLLFIPFIPLWILLCNHLLAPDWNAYATWYRRRDRKGLGFEDLYRAMGVPRP